MSDPIETKLAAARTRLILDKPFLGALALRLPLVAAGPSWCPTTATDARHFYYNPDYVRALSVDEAQFVLAHEALHCALSHFARRQHRIKHRWDLACDLAINPLLIDDGLRPPPNALAIDLYRGMTAEEIYPLLDDLDDERETLDRHLYDSEPESEGQRGANDSSHGKSATSPDRQAEPDATPGGTGGRKQMQRDETGNSQDQHPPRPLTPDERETLSTQWQQRLAGAAQQALKVGKLSGALARLVDHLLQPRLPWRHLLAHYISNTARDDFSYARPSRREGSAILPILHSGQIDLVVAIDTSGSIKENEISEFFAEIDAIKGQIRASVTLLPCDSALARGAPWRFEPWEEFCLPDRIERGGGTDFRPVFDWIAQQGIFPALLVYFTDAQGPFPDRPPPYPVLWLVKGKTPIPWGQRVQLN